MYAEAYDLTGDENFKHVVVGILGFVEREMLDKDGGFYSALDAETDAEEGKFYRWDRARLDKIIGPEDMKLFGAIYNLNGEPNFEEHYYVPKLSMPLTEAAKKYGMTFAELEAKLAPVRQQLLAAPATPKSVR